MSSSAAWISSPLRDARSSRDAARSWFGKAAAVGIENPEPGETLAVQQALDGRLQHTQAVDDASEEVDGRGLGEVPSGARNLADPEPKAETLREHLVVEHESVGVLEQRQCLEHVPAERAK